MKKLLLVVAALAIFSCSSSDDNTNCQFEVTGLNKSCAGDDCIFDVTYSNLEESFTIETNEATFDFYTNVVNDNEDIDCWEGEK